MTTEQLKGCPFCGETEEVYHAGVIHCDACGAEGPAYQEDYRAAWNRRTPELSAQTAVKTEQPSLSDARILELANKHNITIGGYTFESEVIAFARDLLSAQRQDSDKDAERYRKAIAYEDNAGLLYCAVMNHCPDKAAIDAEFDAEAIDVGL